MYIIVVTYMEYTSHFHCYHNVDTESSRYDSVSVDKMLTVYRSLLTFYGNNNNRHSVRSKSLQFHAKT